jgi:hypothetical protein
LYGCEILREEDRLRVFENRVLRRIRGSKRYEIIGEWRQLHDEKLNNLHSSSYIIRMKSRRVRWPRHVAAWKLRKEEEEEEEECIQGFGGKTRRKQIARNLRT